MPSLDWLESWLDFLRLRPRCCKLVLLGLENAGKSTLLHRLKNGDGFKQQAPSLHPTEESFALEGQTVTAYDPGGILAARRIWVNTVLQEADCVVFVIDAVDKERFPEVKAELDSLLSDEHVSEIPVLILGNKIDSKDAVSEEEFKHRLNLFGVLTGKSSTRSEGSAFPGRPVELFMCSVLTHRGYGEGITWLFSQFKK